MAAEDFALPEKMDNSDDDDGRLDVGDLCRMFEQSEEATLTARGEFERDRDYLDNIQHTAEEIATLEKRGQPIVTDNRIKTKIDFLVGLEKQQRIDPKALAAHAEARGGRGRRHPGAALRRRHRGLRRQALRGVAQHAGRGRRRHPRLRRAVAQDDRLRRTARWKSRSTTWPGTGCSGTRTRARPDFSDAGYLGVVVWMDYDDALAHVPGRQGGARHHAWRRRPIPTPTTTSRSSRRWADKKRKRVRICQMWIKRDDELALRRVHQGRHPEGRPVAVRDRQRRERLRVVLSVGVRQPRERPLRLRARDDLACRTRSTSGARKSLHVLNTKQIVMTKGAVDDIEKARARERAAGWHHRGQPDRRRDRRHVPVQHAHRPGRGPLQAAAGGARTRST